MNRRLETSLSKVFASVLAVIVATATLSGLGKNGRIRLSGFRGAIRITSHGGIGGIPFPLLPLAPELCRYSDSKYASATEPANITLDLPDYHLRKNPPPGFYIDDLSFTVASAQLKSIHRLNPLTRWATVVVEGIVFVRKYNEEIQRRAAERKIRGLTGPPL